MRERLEAHCGALAEQVPWAQEPRSASVYVQNILKETSTLYNVLRQTLSGHELQCVFDEIFAMFNAQLVEYYSLLRLSNMGKKRYAQIKVPLRCLCLTWSRRLQPVDRHYVSHRWTTRLGRARE